MRRLLLIASFSLVSFSLAATSALAGMQPRFAQFMDKHALVTQTFEAKKAKLPKAQASSVEASLKSSYDKMYRGLGTMVRGDYYALADEQSRILDKISADLAAR